MRINHFSHPTSFHSVENTALRSYATAERAEKHATDWLECYGLATPDDDVRATILIVTRADGRFVPVIVAQGKDAAQFACANAQSGNGIMCFA